MLWLFKSYPYDSSLQSKFITDDFKQLSLSLESSRNGQGLGNKYSYILFLLVTILHAVTIGVLHLNKPQQELDQ